MTRISLYAISSILVIAHVLHSQSPVTPGVDFLTKSGETATAEFGRAAIERSLPVLQATDVTFIQKSGCVSCHHNSLTAMTVSTARESGIPVDDAIASGQVKLIAAYLESWMERILRGSGIPGGADTVSYILLGLGAENYPPDAVTDTTLPWRLHCSG